MIIITYYTIIRTIFNLYRDIFIICSDFQEINKDNGPIKLVC